MALAGTIKKDWEKTFSFWAGPPSDTEQQKCLNAERVIKSILKSSDALNNPNIHVFVQGSYRNRTNVRADSDVDICVLCQSPFFPDYDFAPGLDAAAVGVIDDPYTYAQFKDDVGKALLKIGGKVTRGNKAFDIHGNTYRVDADVVPCFEHRRYLRDERGEIIFITGTELRPDNGGKIINWPDQHYNNGVAKNERTGRAYKSVIRILKHLRNQMKDNGVQEAENAPSFLIECLVWNVPDALLTASTWQDAVRGALLFIHGQITNGHHTEWGEISELKYLFRNGQPWRAETATQFVEAAWGYLGF